jgi:signal transduction histidine kinase
MANARRWLAGDAARSALPALALALVAFFLSTEVLFQSGHWTTWETRDVLSAWLEYLAELCVLTGILYATYRVMEAAARRYAFVEWVRLVAIATALYGSSFAYALGSAMWRNRMAVPPDGWFAAAIAGRWAVIAIYAVLIQSLWQRVNRIEQASANGQRAAETLARELQSMKLQLLKAQIEPHFLFNTLANVRRLYAMEPDRGQQMMQSLKRYLRVALPGVRRDRTTLSDELDLVRDYLALIGVRMSQRLSYQVVDASGRSDIAFPAMVILTLVENAIRHGIEPSATGGHVEVRASADHGELLISVRDNGAGLGSAQSGGTGVGLSNIRNQLRAGFGGAARLQVRAADPGVEATVTIPLPQ